MDYSKMGGAKPPKNTPKHAEHNAYGTDKTPFSKKDPKAALLERMKRAAQKKDG
ncbi:MULTISPECIES: hypothetical protein [Thioclava]|uniref:hypothetical protein n=1 Tax=Thioclava TaxID=285107 RepID=UPI0014128B7A|nr:MULTISPECIES: hypothetical protein [Thioclava]WGT51016.1 hypothetical protein P0N61_02990 [Thioclava nitratireducens]